MYAVSTPARSISSRARRPDEVQVDVILTKGFWTAKHEATQGQWRRVAGAFPDRLPSAAFGEGDEFPVYWINFDEAETFCSACRSACRLRHQSHRRSDHIGFRVVAVER